MPQRPPSRVADTRSVEMVGDGLNTHRPRGAVPLPSQGEDQPHGLGLERIDLQGLLDAVAALLAGDDAVADGRQRTIPKPLAGVSFMSHNIQLVLARDTKVL